MFHWKKCVLGYIYLGCSQPPNPKIVHTVRGSHVTYDTTLYFDRTQTSPCLDVTGRSDCWNVSTLALPVGEVHRGHLLAGSAQAPLVLCPPTPTPRFVLSGFPWVPGLMASDSLVAAELCCCSSSMHWWGLSRPAGAVLAAPCTWPAPGVDALVQLRGGRAVME